ncbi:MAG: hypothetical protein M3O46_12875 [Myxococcota bacterium]|nr:hypothetical protein [Myxococcota bacterium]
MLRVDEWVGPARGLTLGLIFLFSSACSSGSGDVIDSGGGSGGGSGDASADSPRTDSASTSSSGGGDDAGQLDATVTPDAKADAGVTCLWDFNDGMLHGWTFTPYRTSADPQVDADGIDPLNLSALSAPSIDTTTGYPATPPGSMVFTIPFSAYNQKADYHVTAIPPVATDLTSKVLTLWLKLEPNPDGGPAFTPSASAPGGLVMYLKMGANYAWGQAPWKNIVDYNWHQYTFDVSNGYDVANTRTDAGYDPTMVAPLEIGFFIHTGGCAVTGDASCPYPNPSPGTFHVDGICMQPAPM